MVAAGTPAEVELTELVTSRTAKSGDHFGVRLAEDLVLNGVVLVRAGALGQGEVIDAAPGSLAGRPGKLILAARWVEAPGLHLPLRSFHLAGTGHDSSKTVAAVAAAPYVGILALGVQGGNIDYRPGTRATAKVAANTLIAPLDNHTSP